MSEPVPHPIRLEQVFFVRSHVVSVPGHQPVEGQVTVPPINQLNVQKDANDANLFIAQMRTRLNEEADSSMPYSVDMECLGFFRADDTLTDEDAHRGVTITAHNVLYGAIREAVSWISARQAYGPMTLGLSVLQSNKPEN